MKLKLLLILLIIPQLVSGYYICEPCFSLLRPCGWWGSAEYLFWWKKERFFPALVTTNPSAIPILSTAGTSVLFGNEWIKTDPKSGFKGDIGLWMSRRMGIGGSFFFLGDEKVGYKLTGDSAGLPIFGQPFTSVTTGPDANLLSFPVTGVYHYGGIVEIDSANRENEFDLYLRYRMLGSKCFKFDFLGGFMYAGLTDNLNINTTTTTTSTHTVVSDHFLCENHYYAGLVGGVAELRKGCWGIKVEGKAGLGNMQNQVTISGTTLSSTSAVLTTLDTGFLAQSSNSGYHPSHKFEVVTQATGALQLKFYRHFWLSVGYSYMFWPAVVLAGDQIDLTLPPSPFKPKRTNYWMQGLTTGLYVIY